MQERFGFGSSTRRFNNLGLHPELACGLISTSPNISMQTYNPRKGVCQHKERQPTGEKWSRQLEMQLYSQTRGFKNLEMVRMQAYEKTLRGPGTHDIPDIPRKIRHSVAKNVGFGTLDRFHVRDKTLPPGIHFKKVIDRRYKPYGTPVPTLEWDGFLDRLKTEDPKFRLPPNLYTYKDGLATADIVNKVVSKRGPYDCSSGPRDITTIKNHFGISNFVPPETYFIPPSDLEELLHSPSRRTVGKFLKAPRFPKIPTIRMLLKDINMCYKDPSLPGPAHYETQKYKTIKPVQPSKFCEFNSSQDYPRGRPSREIRPGVGRYNPKSLKCLKTKAKFSWIFAPRTAGRILNKSEPPPTVKAEDLNAILLRTADIS